MIIKKKFIIPENTLKISPAIIWISSIFLGLLSYVLQIAEHHFNPAEAAVNTGITATFALFSPPYSSEIIFADFLILELETNI